MLLKKLTVIILVSLTTAWVAEASHIVGGYLSYECLGNNQYKITNREYRDCLNGIPFYSAVNLVIKNSVLDTTISIPRYPTVPVNLDTSNCISPVAGLCVEYADYIDTLTLPPSLYGYELSIATCCRNRIIQNIPNPSGTSTFFSTSIPPNDTACNSSAYLVGAPPIFLCLNRAISLPLNIQEPDGDSLSYSLCPIMQGINGVGGPINFNPPFTYNNPFQANPPFSIDPQTGVLQGTPTQIGHNVVGICVSEYRNGQLLSTMRLDYEFNVTTCTVVASDILTQAEDSSLYCIGLNMNFTAQSPNANKYWWDFGDTTTLADTSRLINTFYNYPRPGTYQVRLVVGAGGCKDTTYATFAVDSVPDLKLSNQGEVCFGEPVIFDTQDSLPPGYSLTWDFGPAASVKTATNIVPPPVSFSQAGDHVITVVAEKGQCTFTETDTITVRDELVSDMVTPSEDSAVNCQGLTVNFKSESKNAQSVFWDFGDASTTQDTSYADSASYTYSQPGTYPIQLIAKQGNGACADTVLQYIEVFDQLQPKFSGQGQYCFTVQDIALRATGQYPSGTKYHWNLGPYVDQADINGPNVSNASWTVPGMHLITLEVTKGLCHEVIQDTVEIVRYPLVAEAGDTQRVDRGQSQVNLQGNAAYQHYWFADRPVQFSSRNQRSTAISLDNTADTITVYLRITDPRGCEGLDSAVIILEGVYDNVDLPNIITPNGDGFNDYFNISALGLGTGGEVELSIMNRWGKEIYNSKPYRNNWNGIDQWGNPVPDGTYYYIIYARNEVVATGPISIVKGTP